MTTKTRYVYFPLNEQKPEIRLLRIRQHEDRKPSDPLSIHVEHARFDETLRYDALSYAWGDPTPKHTILLNGHEHRIATNLFVALETLGKPGVVENPLWIDALCINQLDLEERGQQVAIMAQLYQRAQNVRVWLGPSGMHTAAAFRVLLNPPETSHDLERVTDDELRGIDDLAGRRWWGRLWMLQEVQAGASSYAHCGDLVGSWSVLTQQLAKHVQRASTAYAIAASDYQFVRRAEWLGLPSLAGNETMPAHWRYYDDVAVYRNLIRILEIGASFGCSDPRDHLFGLLGLLPPELSIRPDYKSSTARVFAAGTAEIVQYSRNFDVLRLAGLRDTRVPGLPSWAADFSLGSNDMDLWRIQNWGKASLGSSLFAAHTTAAELKVRYLPVDTCVTVGRAMPSVEKRPIAGWSEELRQILRDWRTLARSLRTNVCPEEASLTFWNMVFNEYVNQAVSGDHSFDEWLDLDEEDATKRPHAINELMTKTTIGTFFITRHGKMGLCFHPSIEVGDTIALLAGARLPTVLRKANTHAASQYHFVSTCTCIGYMTGEAVQGPARALLASTSPHTQNNPPPSPNQITAALSHRIATRTAADIEPIDRVSDPLRFDLSDWPKPIFLDFFSQAFRTAQQPASELWPDLPERMRQLDQSAVRTHFVELYESLSIPHVAVIPSIWAPFVGMESAGVLCALLTTATRALLCSALAQVVSEALDDFGCGGADRGIVSANRGFFEGEASWMLRAIDAPARTREVRKMADSLFAKITLV